VFSGSNSLLRRVRSSTRRLRHFSVMVPMAKAMSGVAFCFSLAPWAIQRKAWAHPLRHKFMLGAPDELPYAAVFLHLQQHTDIARRGS
jgi:hypothetical protein